MAKSLADFLHELDSNAELKENYLKDPVGVAQNYGLSEDDVQLIKDQDWDTMRKRFNSAGIEIKNQAY